MVFLTGAGQTYLILSLFHKYVYLVFLQLNSIIVFHGSFQLTGQKALNIQHFRRRRFS